jgi:hypothetical protein
MVPTAHCNADFYLVGGATAKVYNTYSWPFIHFADLIAAPPDGPATIEDDLLNLWGVARRSHVRWPRGAGPCRPRTAAGGGRPQGRP